VAEVIAMPFGIGWRGVLASVTPVAVLGTLLCCVLPIALVGVGLGSVLVSLLGAAPWIIVLQHYKAWIFAFAALMLLVNYRALYRSGRACTPGGVCHSSHPVGRWMRRIYWGSVVAYGAGVFAAYLSLPVARLLGFSVL
jgi:mercuric ion transport protein